MHRCHFIVAALVAAVSILAAVPPAHALTNASIAADGTFSGNRIAGYCAYADPFFIVRAVPNTDDGGGQDYYAVVHTDGYGTVLDVDLVGLPVGTAVVATPEDTHAGIGAFAPLAARPITATLYDVGNPGAIDPNSLAGLAFARAGTLLSTGTFDPIAYEPDCANFPLVAPLPAPVPQAAAPDAASAWNPNDGRLNVDPTAPVAVYCGPNTLYAYAPGYLVLEAPLALVQTIGLPPINVLLADSGDGVSLYRLTSGEFQINAVRNGQVYVFVWDACPPTYTSTRIYDAATWALLSEQTVRR